ncbi:hypothetical protein LDL79_03045 [Leeuwenhoekiella palythoae]|uniref:hypothetical protein n=1 Tax=Leeuwenhoekiella palythoae TaxID=573501 RepID=UPI001CE0F31F|nr:hypothetical protein [Leeuwenhoekiella palythoae]UBZ11104.1 hypothetical protein LDL79_03045 [Leeuwenhoekiella palythoae]
MNKSIFLLLTLAILSCKQNYSEESKDVPEQEQQVTTTSNPFVDNIASAHNKAAFAAQEAVAFDLQLMFGGNERINATISMLTNSSKIRIDKTDGTQLIYDGSQVYSAPQGAIPDGARFDIFTWPYFFAFPFKLQDPGVNIQELANDAEGQFKLTFEGGTGDTPDDWYIGYLDEENRVEATAYIVTFGDKTIENAEAAPHAIAYSDYKEIEQVPLATTWKFYNWSEEKGNFGDPIGEAHLSNIRFFEVEDGFFEKPESSDVVNY